MLTIQTLSFKHPNGYLFKNLNFQLNLGELLQVTGKNGCGKTTLLRILANLLKSSDGDIHYANQSIYQNPTHYQTAIGYLGHTSAIKPGLTVRENLLSHASLMGIKKPNVESLVEKLTLLSVINKFAYQLSQGQQRRLALAKIILAEKPIWILDEPLTAIDDEGVALFNGLVTEHLHNKGMAIIATHQPLNLKNITVKQFLL